RFGWGPYHKPGRRYDDDAEPADDGAMRREFLAAALARARAFHRALARRPETRCPARVILLGGDCLPTLGRALVPPKKGLLPRFDPRSEEEAAAMMEAGDGRVTRASVLASHLPEADDSDTASGLPEVGHAFFGSADHHGIYREPTFQSILLRLLLRPSRPRLVEIRERRTASPANLRVPAPTSRPRWRRCGAARSSTGCSRSRLRTVFSSCPRTAASPTRTRPRACSSRGRGRKCCASACATSSRTRRIA